MMPHPLFSTYPGASFHPTWDPTFGNVNGRHLAAASGGDSFGYWGKAPWEPPAPPQWDLPPAVVAMMEGRGTGIYGMPPEGRGAPFNYGWPKYGPVSRFNHVREASLTDVRCR